jgi:hypothetical protein
MALNGYSEELGAQKKSGKELNFHGSIDCDKLKRDYSCRWSNVKSNK